MIQAIRRFFLKRKIIRQLRDTNCALTAITLEKGGPWDGNVRVRPTDDGFDHSSDDCACVPTRETMTRENGTTYEKIVHHRMK